MWLLDVNMPRPLIAALGKLGINAQTAGDQGWEALTNGRLVEAAVSKGFTCLLTRDQLFGESAARALKNFPQFSVILITIPQMKGTAFVESFNREWRTTPIKPVPGKITQWPT